MTPQRFTALLTVPLRTVRAVLGPLALAVLMTAGGCAGVPAPEPAPVSGTRLALWPMVDMARVYGGERQVRTPLTGKVFVTGQPAGALAAHMTDIMESTLRARGGFRLISPGTIEGAAGRLIAGDAPSLPERRLLIGAGAAVNADAVLVGHLYRYRPRQGGRLAVERPASLAYGLYLMALPEGRIVWSRVFDETQRALNENLLALGTFLKRRGSWITAEEMAEESLHEILAAFPAPEGEDNAAP